MARALASYTLKEAVSFQSCTSVVLRKPLLDSPAPFVNLLYEPPSCGASTHSNLPRRAHTWLVPRHLRRMCLRRNKPEVPARKESNGRALEDNQLRSLRELPNIRDLVVARLSLRTAIETVARCHVFD